MTTTTDIAERPLQFHGVKLFTTGNPDVAADLSLRPRHVAAD